MKGPHRLLIGLLAFLAASAQSTVYLRSSGPDGFRISTCTTTTPVLCTTTTPHGLAVGDTIIIANALATVSNKAVWHSVNGIRKIKTVPSPTTFAVTDLAGIDVTANGPWQLGTFKGFGQISSAAPVFGGKVNPFPLRDHPRGWLDGEQGPLSRKFATTNHNGLSNITVNGSTATVNLSYPHGLSSGNRIGIWKSATTALNGTFPITVTGPQSLTFTTTAPAGTYTDALVSQLAHSSNPAWTHIQTIGAGAGCLSAMHSAMTWYITGSAAALACAKEYLLHIESPVGSGHYGFGDFFPIDPSKNVGGNNDTDYVSGRMSRFALVYTLIRQALTPEERALIIEKVWRDVEDGCTPNYISRMAYSSGTVVSATTTSVTFDSGASAVDDFYVGDTFYLINGPAGFETYSQASSLRVVRYVGATRTAYVVGNWANAEVPKPGSQYEMHAGVMTVAYLHDKGTARGGTDASITLSSTASGTRDRFTHMTVSIVAGTGAGQSRTITAYNGSTKVATVDTAWTTAPNSTSSYEISIPRSQNNTLDSSDRFGIIQDVGLDNGRPYVTLPSTANASGAAYTSLYLTITAGPGAGQGKIIASYPANLRRAYLFGTWSTPPVAGVSRFEIRMLSHQSFYPLYRGQVQSTTATTVQLDSNAPSTLGGTNYLAIVGGTGAGQRNKILNFDGTSKTVTVIEWSTPPDTTSVYEVQTAASPIESQIESPKAMFLTHPDASKRIRAGETHYSDILKSVTAGDPPRVTSVISDTVLRVDGTTRFDWTDNRYWNKWTSANCGMVWFSRHHRSSPATQPVLYPPTGGTPTEGLAPHSNTTITKVAGDLLLALVFADEDPRAMRRLQEVWAYFWDYPLKHALTYWTGFNQSSSYYGYGRPGVLHSQVLFAAHTFEGFPELMTDAHVNEWMAFLMYSYYPSSAGIGRGFTSPFWWGSDNGDTRLTDWGQGNVKAFFTPTIGQTMQGGAFAPYYSNWVTNKINALAGYSHETSTYPFLYFDRNLPAMDYRSLPLQRIFRNTSQGLCQSLGLTCAPNRPMGGFMSISNWDDPKATHIGIHANTWVKGDTDHSSIGSSGDHNTFEAGSYRIWKGRSLVGVNGSGVVDEDSETSLLSADFPDALQSSSEDCTRHCNMLRISTSLEDSAQKNIRSSEDGAIVRFERWAGDPVSGDPQNRYVYSMLNLTDYYSSAATPKRIHRHFAHLKQPGRDELLIIYDDVETVSGRYHAGRVHYQQNAINSIFIGAEGSTTCPGGDPNCSTLNSTRLIQSVTAPEYDSGLVTRFYDPTGGNLRVYVDASDGTYNAGTRKNTFRVSYCNTTDGGATCNPNATQTEALLVHKIAGNQTDLTLNSTQISQLNWTGVETQDSVVLFSRKGILRDNLSVSTSHAGTAVYLIAGLAPATYTVTRNGQVTGIYTVKDGDSTLYFESLSGTFTVAGQSVPLTVPAITPSFGMVLNSYSHQLSAYGGSAPYTWSIVGGSLCNGLYLNADGRVWGVPLASGSCTFTAKVTDATAQTATAVTTITITDVAFLTNADLFGTTAVIRYGFLTLRSDVACIMTISANGQTSKTITDGGGPSRRQVVIEDWSDETLQDVDLDCGGRKLQPAFSLQATGSSPVSSRLVLQLHPPRRSNATSVKVDYGVTDPSANSTTVACAGGCAVTLPELSGGHAYQVKVTWLTGTGAIAGGTRSVVVP